MTSRNLILGTAGHVDHGKTSLVKALTGIETDRLPEEKARGLTIDLGFASLSLGEFFLGIVDVPGHEDFIRNMIAGLGAIDLALLVVAVDDGWMPQTEEHLQILDYLGIRHGVVAITKCDLGNAERVASEVREQLRGSSLGDAPIVCTSVRNLDGFGSLKETLVHVCQQIPPPRDNEKPRLFVDRAFSMRGAGTIVTGTLTGGRLARGETVVLQPQNISARIRALQNHNRSQESAPPGSRVALNLPELRVSEIPRGTVIVSAMPAKPSRKVDLFVRRAGRGRLRTPSLKKGAVVDVHIGSGREVARIDLLDRTELLRGEEAIARLIFTKPIFAFVGDRLVIRDSSARHTLAGGLVLDPDAVGLKFRSLGQSNFLRARTDAPDDPAVLLRAQLRRDGFAQQATLLLKSNFSPTEIDATIAELAKAGVVVVRDEVVADSEWWKSLFVRAEKAIDAAHAEHPDQAGLDLRQLHARLGLRDPHLFDAFVGYLCENGFERAEGFVRRRAHSPSLPPQLQRAANEIRTALKSRPFDPPAKKALIRDQTTRDALKFLCATNEAVSLDGEIILSAAALAEMQSRVKQLLRVRGGATTSELRQSLGTTRRVLIPLLEYFDRTGLTKREGDRRVRTGRGD